MNWETIPQLGTNNRKSTITSIASISGVHRPLEGQGRNGIMRAQSQTGEFPVPLG